jgi:hypothetical protein
MTDVDLDHLARQQECILAEIDGLRDDIRVLAVTLLRAISGAAVARTKISCLLSHPSSPRTRVTCCHPVTSATTTSIM